MRFSVGPIHRGIPRMIPSTKATTFANQKLKASAFLNLLAYDLSGLLRIGMPNFSTKLGVPMIFESKDRKEEEEEQQQQQELDMLQNWKPYQLEQMRPTNIQHERPSLIYISNMFSHYAHPKQLS